MAGNNRYTALLDANVLYSVAISDALMEVAATGIYAAKWSRHVLAAAIAGHADSIVTINIKDFPASKLNPLGVTALHPDEFLLQQLELEPLVVLPAFKVMRARLKNPAFTPGKFADVLERNGLIQTAAFLRQALQLI